MNPLLSTPLTLALLHRASSHKNLTPAGLLVAAATATIHAWHPSSSLPFTLLGVFFLLGTAATKVKHDVKVGLTLSASGGGGAAPGGASRRASGAAGDGAGSKGGRGRSSSSSGSSGGGEARTHVQVLANSGVASALVLLSIFRHPRSVSGDEAAEFLILLGIAVNYAAVAADTLSSELGILSQGLPWLITTGKKVPRGTNGGVSLLGLAAGVGGSAAVAVVSGCMVDVGGGVGRRGIATTGGVVQGEKGWELRNQLVFVSFVAIWGALGSVLDSLLGAVLQGTVEDKRTGKVVEAAGGMRVLTTSKVASVSGKAGRVLRGRDILDNNQVNFVMALMMSVGGMVVGSWIWDVSLSEILR